LRSYFSFLRRVKSANTIVFKDFYDEGKMKKNKQDGGSYFVIVPQQEKHKASTPLVKRIFICTGNFFEIILVIFRKHFYLCSPITLDDSSMV